MTQMRVSEAATLLGVSDDTIRRWIDSGRLKEGPSDGGRQTVDSESVASAMADQQADAAPNRQSARNRFPGIVTKVERDGVMAMVEIQAGPHLVTSLMSRASADDLGLEVGSRVTAIVKSTNVVVAMEES